MHCTVFSNLTSALKINGLAIELDVVIDPCLIFFQMYKIERVFVDTRKRKRRTSLEGTVRSALESYFVKCPKPNTLEITHISDDLGLERDVSMLQCLLVQS